MSWRLDTGNGFSCSVCAASLTAPRCFLDEETSFFQCTYRIVINTSSNCLRAAFTLSTTFLSISSILLASSSLALFLLLLSLSSSFFSVLFSSRRAVQSLAVPKAGKERRIVCSHERKHCFLAWPGARDWWGNGPSRGTARTYD